MMIFNRIAGLIMGITLLFFLGLGFLTFLTIREGINLRTLSQNETRELAVLQEKRTALASLTKNKSTIQSLYEKAFRILPETENSIIFVSEWEQLKQASHLEEESFSFLRTTAAANKEGGEKAKTQKSESKKSEELRFSADLKGTIADFISFLNNIEQGPRLVTLGNLTYTSSGNDRKLNINGSVYHKANLSLSPEDQANWQLSPLAKEKLP